MPCICFRECGRTASSQDDCNLCEADGDCQSHSWADNPATSWSVNDWQVPGAALRSQRACHQSFWPSQAVVNSVFIICFRVNEICAVSKHCSPLLDIAPLALKDIKGKNIMVYLKKGAKKDGWRHLLPLDVRGNDCPSPDYHHPQRGSMWGEDYLFVISSNKLCLRFFLLQDRIGSDRDKNFRSLDGTGSAKIVKADNNQ